MFCLAELSANADLLHVIVPFKGAQAISLKSTLGDLLLAIPNSLDILRISTIWSTSVDQVLTKC